MEIFLIGVLVTQADSVKMHQTAYLRFIHYTVGEFCPIKKKKYEREGEKGWSEVTTGLAE